MYSEIIVSLFLCQMRKGLNAEEVLVEIVQDNLWVFFRLNLLFTATYFRTIVSKMADTQMGYMIEQFCTTEVFNLKYIISFTYDTF